MATITQAQRLNSGGHREQLQHDIQPKRNPVGRINPMATDTITQALDSLFPTMAGREERLRQNGPTQPNLRRTKAAMQSGLQNPGEQVIDDMLRGR